MLPSFKAVVDLTHRLRQAGYETSWLDRTSEPLILQLADGTWLSCGNGHWRVWPITLHRPVERYAVGVDPEVLVEAVVQQCGER